MPACTIPLGTHDRLTGLYSYPNIPGSHESLADTIAHWFRQTLERDGLADATAAVRVQGEAYYLDLDGPPEAAERFPEYGVRLPRFLENGYQALTEVIPQLHAQKRWDPQNTGQWRFFLPLGLAMVNQRSLQFFHYPPSRLLDPMRDYLKDPVPKRWTELLEANGVPTEKDTWLYQTVIDGAPIAATDDQGSAKGGDPSWGLIPIQQFNDYQKEMVRLLLNPAPGHDDYTIPVVAYGKNPRDTFLRLYNVKLGVNVAVTAEIVPGKKTAVLGANHPYLFYWQAQDGRDSDKRPDDAPQVGSGKINFSSPQYAQIATTMIQDLVAARWQVLMAKDPTRDPQEVLKECNTYWASPARSDEICALIVRHGSLYYQDPDGYQFDYLWALQQARAL